MTTSTSTFSTEKEWDKKQKKKTMQVGYKICYRIINSKGTQEQNCNRP